MIIQTPLRPIGLASTHIGLYTLYAIYVYEKNHCRVSKHKFSKAYNSGNLKWEAILSGQICYLKMNSRKLYEI